MVDLVEPMLTQLGCRALLLHWRVANRTEGAELGVMDSAARIQLAHLADDGAVGIGARADDELHGHPRGPARMELVARTPRGLLAAAAQHVQARRLQRRHRRGEALVR